MVEKVASRTHDEAGDGTTTATVLAQAIFKEGMKAVAAGMNPMDLKRGSTAPWPRSAPCPDPKLTSLASMVPLLEAVIQVDKQLLIVAEDIEGEALATLVVNKLHGGLKVAAVKAPGFGDRRNAMLEDLAILTSGELISADLGTKLESMTLDMLGTARKIAISKNDTTVINGGGDKAVIASRVIQIHTRIGDTTSDYDKEELLEWLARLAGGVAVIRVGGATEIEVTERKDWVDDALHATRAAVQEGVLPKRFEYLSSRDEPWDAGAWRTAPASRWGFGGGVRNDATPREQGLQGECGTMPWRSPCRSAVCLMS